MTASEQHSHLNETLAAIRPVAAECIAEAAERQLTLTKPPGSLGELESIGNRLAGIARCCPPPIPDPALLVVFAADHGVQAQGVSPWPQAVTRQMALNIVSGGAAVSVLARSHGAELRVVDVGMLEPVDGVEDRRVRSGSADLSEGPAMTEDELLQAIGVGLAVADEAAKAGFRCLLGGEVGIGNTTASAALISVFTGAAAEVVTGAGAGAAGEMLQRKREAVRRGIEVNGATADAPLAALAAVGGLEHAALVGLMLGGAAHGLPVILDGVIVCSAALAAQALCPAASGYFIAAHNGTEPGIVEALRALDLHQILDLGLRLGEGSGAVAALPLVRSAAAILREMATFSSAGVSGSTV